MRASLCVASGRVRDAPSLRPKSSRAHPSPRSECFSCCFRQLQIPVAAAQARMLVRRLPSCQSAVEHALQTITTPSALSVSCLALASQFSLPLSLSLCASLSFLCFLFSLFLLNSSKPWVNEEEVRRAAWIVCLSDFLHFDLVKALSCDVFSSWKSHSVSKRLCTSEQQNTLLWVYSREVLTPWPEVLLKHR